ncbi:hypothetical protein PQG02_23825 [Nostoc sp. UHCC 0926]|uniref:hypothetical protein n=1 Tax=unclassified Nostoc TaxID=2593658 RepID=UPI0023616CEB|nr:hypothetical protein [Nostoc sp. UHCC 0926]WDD31695.1 hypothetical protein PQG02_23825 [Nostoc sp. UHCC 0926]
MSNDKPKKRLRFVFEVFCKAIALENVRSAIAHSSTTGDACGGLRQRSFRHTSIKFKT